MWGMVMHMQKIVKSRSHTIGLPPGSLVHVGERKRQTSVITLIEYSEEKLEKKQLTSEKIMKLGDNYNGIRWIHIEGLQDLDIFSELGEAYKLHPLVLEDILNTDQRPKIIINDNYIFVCSKMLSYNTEKADLEIEQVSFVLGRDFLLSFTEKDTDCFEPIIKRLKQSDSRIRKLGADYLLFCLLDVMVDNYFSVLESISEKIEATEDEMVIRTSNGTLKSIHEMRRQVLFIHKSIWPLRDVLSSLVRGESGFIKETTEIYIRDLYDHVIQVMDTVETLRDILSNMLDIYLSSTSNRMNEVMKILTMISTIFMPLTFIVGIYGMNIRNMPELNWPWLYPALWALMAAITVSMLYFFKKKKWW